MEQEFLTDEQLCTRLHVGARTTLRWRREGGGPMFVVAGLRRILYRLSDVEAWENDRTHGHTSMTKSHLEQSMEITDRHVQAGDYKVGDTWRFEVSPLEAILRHLEDSIKLASQIGREDLMRKLGRLVRDVKGPQDRRFVNNALSVSPDTPVDFHQWLNDVHQALHKFEQDYEKAHFEDPLSFPMTRTSSGWFAEFLPHTSQIVSS